jgi:hypothetical protein
MAAFKPLRTRLSVLHVPLGLGLLPRIRRAPCGRRRGKLGEVRRVVRCSAPGSGTSDRRHVREASPRLEPGHHPPAAPSSPTAPRAPQRAEAPGRLPHRGPQNAAPASQARPGQPLIPPATGVAPPMANFPFETTRTAIQLVLNGVVDRYPGLRMILSHAGGFLPYGSLRFAELARVFNPAAPSPMPSWPASASTSTRRCPQAPPCPPSRHSPAPATSCSAPTPPTTTASPPPLPPRWTPPTA